MKYSDQTVVINQKQTKQVNKPTARKAFEAGKTVYLNACNMRINNAWTSPMPVNKKELELNPHYTNINFDSIVNEYTYYNCCNERGTYPNFFVETV